MEMFGYKCTLQTDTEVITYIADYLLRKQKLTLEELVSVIAAPFWSTIDRKPPQEQEKLRYLPQGILQPAYNRAVLHCTGL